MADLSASGGMNAVRAKLEDKKRGIYGRMKMVTVRTFEKVIIDTDEVIAYNPPKNKPQCRGLV